MPCHDGIGAIFVSLDYNTSHLSPTFERTLDTGNLSRRMLPIVALVGIEHHQRNQLILFYILILLLVTHHSAILTSRTISKLPYLNCVYSPFANETHTLIPFKK